MVTNNHINPIFRQFILVRGVFLQGVNIDVTEAQPPLMFDMGKLSIFSKTVIGGFYKLY